MIGVITAYLKYYYPVEYMTALLNSFINNADKLKLYLSVVKKMGIEVLPPDINLSDQMFSVENGKIRFGLQGIKNLGKSSENIIDERKKNGPFKDPQDFAERMAKHSKIDKKIMEAMIYSGAMDSFGYTRNALLESMDKILNLASEMKKAGDQISLFDLTPEFDEVRKIHIENVPEFKKREKLEKEREYAGFYVTEHPLDEYADYLRLEGVLEISSLLPDEDETGIGDVSPYEDQNVKVAGIIRDLKIKYTKTEQKPFSVFSLEDQSGDIRAVCFPDRHEMHYDVLSENNIVVVEGQVRTNDFGTQIIVQNIYSIDAKWKRPRAIWVKVSDEMRARRLIRFVSENRGEVPVYFLYNNKKYQVKEKIQLDLMTLSQLQDMFGQNVKVVY